MFMASMPSLVGARARVAVLAEHAPRRTYVAAGWPPALRLFLAAFLPVAGAGFQSLVELSIFMAASPSRMGEYLATDL